MVGLQTTAALCSVLSAALERLPEAFLRSNFSSATSAVEAVITQHPGDVSMLPSKLPFPCRDHFGVPALVAAPVST